MGFWTPAQEHQDQSAPCCRSALRAVPLTDEAHLGGAVQVVEASIMVKVSAVFVPRAETMVGPAVRLPRLPPPMKNYMRRVSR